MAEGTRLTQISECMASLKKSVEQQEQSLKKTVEQQEHNLGAFGTRLDKKFEAIFSLLKELKTSTKKSPHPAEPIHQWGESSAYNKNRGHQGEYNNLKHKEVEIQQSMSRVSSRYHQDHTAWRYAQEENFQDQYYYDNSSPWQNHQEDHYQDRQFHETSNEWQRQQEIQQKEYKWYQERQQKLQEEHQYEYRRTQEEKHGYLKTRDNLIEWLGQTAKQELVQEEEERNKQIKKAEEKIQEQEKSTSETAESSNPLEGIDDQTAESIGDLNLIYVHNDELLDLSSEIESIDFKKLQLVSEKAKIKEGIEKLTAEQEIVKIFSESDGLYCNAEKTFDKKLERELVDDVFFLGYGRWCFDPGKKVFLLEETFSNLNRRNDSNIGALDLSKKLESMELETLRLSSENAKNKAREVIGMSKSEKASPVVLAIWRMTDGGFNQVSVLRKISWRAKMNLKLHLLKYLVVLRHRWRWKDGVL